MIPTNDQLKLKQLYQKYSGLHDELTELENQLQNLLNRHTVVSQELEITRNLEKILINKIEESINQSLTQDDLIKIVNS